jgi:hypothetical protein
MGFNGLRLELRFEEDDEEGKASDGVGKDLEEE